MSYDRKSFVSQGDLEIGAPQRTALSSHPVTLSFGARGLGRVLGGIVLALIGCHLIGQYCKYELGNSYIFGLVPRFDLNEEFNIPTTFSVFQILLAAALLGILWRYTVSIGDPQSRRWGFLSGLFLFLAVDESAKIHELFNQPYFSESGTPGAFRFAWVIVYIPAVIALFLWMWPFFRRLVRPLRSYVALAAFLYLGGAIGVEMISGWYSGAFGFRNFGYAVITAIEEGAEMTGVTLFIYALARHMAALSVSGIVTFREK